MGLQMVSAIVIERNSKQSRKQFNIFPQIVEILKQQRTRFSLLTHSKFKYMLNGFHSHYFSDSVPKHYLESSFWPAYFDHVKSLTLC